MLTRDDSAFPLHASVAGPSIRFPPGRCRIPATPGSTPVRSARKRPLAARSERHSRPGKQPHGTGYVRARVATPAGSTESAMTKSRGALRGRRRGRARRSGAGSCGFRLATWPRADMCPAVPRRGRDVLLPGSDPAGQHGVSNAVVLERHNGRRANLVPAAGNRRLSDQEFPCNCRVTEASSDIYGVSPDAEGAGVSRVSHEYLATLDSDVNVERRRPDAHGGEHGPSSAHGMLRLVAAGCMQSERRHEAVAKDLLDLPTMLVDMENEVVQQGAHRLVDDLRVVCLGEAGETADVGEQDGNLATGCGPLRLF